MNQGEQQSESWIDHKQSQPKHKHQEVNAIKNATNMFTQRLTLKPRSYQCIIYTGNTNASYKRQHKISKRTRYPININSTAIHISIRRYGDRFHIKRLLWCQFVPELTWYALPLNYLDSKSQEQWKGFLNQMNILEFDPESITSDKK